MKVYIVMRHWLYGSEGVYTTETKGVKDVFLSKDDALFYMTKEAWKISNENAAIRKLDMVDPNTYNLEPEENKRRKIIQCAQIYCNLSETEEEIVNLWVEEWEVQDERSDSES